MFRHAMHEIVLHSGSTYANAFMELDVFAELSGLDGDTRCVRGFYDGDNTWRIRVAPPTSGTWRYRTWSQPADDGLASSGVIVVDDPIEGHGMLRTLADEGRHGLRFDDGTPLLMLGDTMYNLFGVAHCGVDIRPVLQHRASQAYNTFRVRMQVSDFHPGLPCNAWQNRSTWAWGGSPQMPDYGRFNLDWFRTVDRVMALLQESGLGVEFIFEAWLMEAPFNDRGRFLPEHEELYIGYAIARYAAFRSLYLWSPANEYNLYTRDPNDPLSGRYAARLARLIRERDSWGHPIGIHVTAAEHLHRPFKELFRDNRDIDVLLLQYWGDISTQRSRDLALHLDTEIDRLVGGSGKVNILAEYGYEAYRDAADASPETHKGLREHHTRRGAWRALMRGLPVMAGFENTWGALFTLEKEPAGAGCLAHAVRFFTEIAEYRSLAVAEDLLLDELENAKPAGERSLAMATNDRATIVVYLPTGLPCGLRIDAPRTCRWFDPMTANMQPAKSEESRKGHAVFSSPGGSAGEGCGKDWVLVVRAA